MTQTEEKIFLLNLALGQFNTQYGHKIRVEDCDIRSIQTRVAFDRGYEISTLRLDDQLRIRLYINFGNADNAVPCRLEVIPPYQPGVLGDEVFVVTATVDKYYIEQGIYRFREVQNDSNLLDIYINEDNVPFVDEVSGEYFLIE